MKPIRTHVSNQSLGELTITPEHLASSDSLLLPRVAAPSRLMQQTRPTGLKPLYDLINTYIFRQNGLIAVWQHIRLFTHYDGTLGMLGEDL